MPISLQAEFEKLWNTGPTPDVIQLLTTRSLTSPEEFVAVVRIDQHHRWRTASPLKVEQYLAAFPELQVNHDLVLELTAGEFLARLQNDQRPQIDEYISRFPQLSEQLQQKLSGLSSTKGQSETSQQVASLAIRQMGLMEIDEICDRFEDAWNSGTDRPPIEAYLQAALQNVRPALLKELLRIELCYRHDRGEKPTLDEYRIRFSSGDPMFNAVLADWEKNPKDFQLHDRVSAAPSTQTVLKAALMSSDQSRSVHLDGSQTIDHFRLISEAGRGTFGRVFRAHDEQLDRAVAIKVPRRSRFKRPEDAELYLAEARMVARLEHPQIVSVYQMGRTPDGSVYVVSQLIEGGTLEDLIKDKRPDQRHTVTLIAQVARALHYAHQNRLIHRDIKPANILIEERTGKPFVADFGLAMKEEDYIKQVVIAGSPAYMSPEQARAEGHRLDGRSDVFSLGVILYEMLTGKRPFKGSTIQETLHQVISVEPRPPRAIDETFPAELERICLRAISKRVSDRYATAEMLAEDLEAWLQAATKPALVSKVDVQVVPKGLRSFDAHDADFFLDLLPGTRNRDGLPESIAFWKQRIEETDPERTFNVGLIYGPSGCGKSSLVKAGLLPHLSKDVIAVYLEATPEETELRILRGLRKRIDNESSRIRENSEESGSRIRKNSDSPHIEIPENLEASGQDRSLTTSTTGLIDTFMHLRRSHHQKVIIIIDQFEQWLHAHRSEPDAELVQALRQCDGVRVQAIVMIRDDFAMAAARFMNALDVPIIQGENFATVDLFEIDHAKNVLIKFGQAFGKLPAKSENLSADEQQFVSDVATGLSQDGKVVSVRLSLFAEMVKSKRWTPETLQSVGGTEGIGVNFLEETFSSPQANPRHRLYATAARAVLKSLLPELGSDIKGHMRSQQELLEASGYADRPADFNDLLRILDGELRLITPTDPEGDSLSGSSRDSSLATRYYQLTHDYLVPSLREWLTRKQRETRRGRAELKLAERAALWTAKPENRHLPSLREWIGIRWLTENKLWTEAQRAVMTRAARVHAGSTAITVVGICLIIAAAFGLNRQANERRNQAEATRLVEGLLAANTTKVSDRLASLKPFRTWADPQLQQEFRDAAPESDAKLHAGLALLSEGKQVDPALLKYLQDRLLIVSPGQIGPVRELMESQKSELIPAYWTVAKDAAQPAVMRFRAACALAGFDAGSSEWKNPEVAALLAEQLVTGSPEYIGEFKELFRPVAPHLVPALSDIFTDPSRGELAKSLATSLLADYAAKDPDTLTDLVIAADAVSDKSLFSVLQKHQTAAVKNLEDVLDQRLEPDWKDQPLDPAWTEPSPADRALIESAHGLIAERFAFCQDMPLSQFLDLAETLRTSGYRPTRVRPHLSLLPLAGGEGGRRPDEGAATVAASLALQVSAIWARDNLSWHIDPRLSKADLPASDALAAKDGLLLAEIAPLPLADEETEPQFIALWCEAHSADADAKGPGADATGSESEERRVLLDVIETELDAAQVTLKQQGFASQNTIAVRTDANGQRRYTGLWSNQGALSELRAAYAGFELVHQPQWDVAVAPINKPPDPLEVYRRRLAAFASETDGDQVREQRARAHFYLKDYASVLTDLDSFGPDAPHSLCALRAVAYAVMGDSAKALADLRRHTEECGSTVHRRYVAGMTYGMLRMWSEFVEELRLLETADDSGESTFSAACVLNVVLDVSGLSAEIPERYSKGTVILLLEESVSQGYLDFDGLKSDPDLASLHADPRFIAFLSDLDRPATYAALWRADIEFESKLLTAVPLDSVLDQLKPLLALGYRPFGIAVNPVPSPPGKGEKVAARPDEGASAAATVVVTPSTEPLCSLVLHRPLILDTAKESLALQQAAAATALLRLNAPDKAWPLFQDQPDPRLRSYVLHRLATYGVNPESLFTQLQQESDVSRQRSLILGLGEFAKAKLLSPEQQTAVIADLTKRYADDPDSGVHGAAEWTLRQLGANAAILEVRNAYSTGTAVGDRRWYLSKTGSKSPGTSGMTFAIIQAEEEFLMGSPVSEAERYQGPTGKNEIRHRRRIGRQFAIGTHEITVSQFRAFRSDHQFDRTKAREEDSPANAITWYDAAGYCNWLSKKEGLSPEQWCYDPDQEFVEGMALVPDYLQRTGYRLPSEAEWENACRAGTTTARYFGETETLLGEYAWYTKTSGDKWMLPVGTLRPNGAGLFDMQGNVLEWCQDAPLLYDTDLAGMGDKEQTGKLSNSQSRVLRGGSFLDSAALVRSANRLSIQPAGRDVTSGFRVARTYP